ncbi:MAG: glycosyltransferase [Hyphomonadaceae bacterium]|nr:glycosyltransferase [Hyphomonadaceae bacterium]
MIAYFAHELADPAVQRRVRMLKAAGETVTLIGFERRAYPEQAGAEAPRHVLGRTQSGRLGARLLSIMGAVPRAFMLRRHWARADAILARNLEMLAAALGASMLAGGKRRIVYECLDIHRLMHGDGVASRLLRMIERLLLRSVDLIVVSSPAYAERYFRTVQNYPGEILLAENKPLGAASVARQARDGPPWRVLWCGNLRCRKSLGLLEALAGAGRAEVELRGVAAADQLPDLQAVVARSERIALFGAYRAEELPAFVADADFIWTVDYFNAHGDAGWSLSNRLYDGLRHGAIPIASAANAETARWMEDRNVGVVLQEPLAETLPAFFASLTAERVEELRAAVRAVPRSDVEMDAAEARAITARILGAAAPMPRAKVLVVIPCLNEAAHLPRLLGDLLGESDGTAVRIVVADGGSTDGGREIVAEIARAHPNVTLLDNPKRVQSAGVNLAVARHGAEADFILRMDAHALYPRDFIGKLLAAQAESGADAVAVSMRTVAAGGGCFQRAVAAAQNSVLGTGGSAHRSHGRRRFVDHGHHALIRRDAFVAAGGYDEGFAQNQDAEFDARLGKRGGRILLAADIVIDYVPRATPGALFRQYFNYGTWRMRTMRRHGAAFKLRQLAPMLVAPAVLAALSAPIALLAALPAAAWLGGCLIYGLILGVRAGSVCACGAGVAAALMHLAWSLGAWTSTAQEGRRAEAFRDDANMKRAANDIAAPADG